jgi:Response regulators consisting of a CheY-like receiver domain and a winged-helix DNA-binding domain
MPPAVKIVIIDDEERIRQLLEDFLEDFEEFTTRACDSAEAALEELARDPADLCIVDMRLPGMNGEGFILTASARGLCRHFILHTGSMDFSLSDKLRKLGIGEADVFLKPADTSEMLARMRVVLGLPGD